MEVFFYPVEVVETVGEVVKTHANRLFCAVEVNLDELNQDLKTLENPITVAGDQFFFVFIDL